MTNGERDVHLPVLLDEILGLLAPSAGERVLDLTVGAGGHAEALVERLGPDGLLVGVDRDRQILEIARARLAGRPVHLVHGNYAHLDELALPTRAFDGILLDLGVSSLQLDAAGRGFSFRHEGPLDMRMDPTSGAPLAELLERWGEGELARIIATYGEERHAGRVARAIVRQQRAGALRSTTDLARVIRAALPRSAPGRIDPATRTFQALRIAVNEELAALEAFLERFDPWLRPGGRLAIIAYHSLEDRLVKEAFRQRSRAGDHELLTRRVVRPTAAEITSNPRARSARLRALRRRGGSGTGPGGTERAA